MAVVVALVIENVLVISFYGNVDVIVFVVNAIVDIVDVITVRVTNVDMIFSNNVVVPRPFVVVVR